MIAIIDYGVGNLFSLRSSLHWLGYDAVVTNKEEDLRKADRIILPGVGAFGDAMEKLTATGLIPVIREEVEKKPLLGICLGMQMLFERSFEFGEHEGLSLVPGEVCPLLPDLPDPSLKVPQMGWNALHIDASEPIFGGFPEGGYVYFVHSFYAKKCAEHTIATCEYGIPVTAAVRCGNVYGTQFHPEKSGAAGMKILRNFCER